MFKPLIESEFCGKVTNEYYVYNTIEYDIINELYQEYKNHFDDGYKISESTKEVYIYNITVLIIMLFDYYEDIVLEDKLEIYKKILEAFKTKKDYIILKIFGDEDVPMSVIKLDIDNHHDLISDLNYKIRKIFEFPEVNVY